MPAESILSHFWELASTDEKTRLDAASELLCALDQAQKQHTRDLQTTEDEAEHNPCCKELEYSVTRLVKGLASSRKGARQGFATVLTEVLSEFNCLSPEKVLQLIAENLEVTGSSKSWEEKDGYLGQIFGLMSVLRSQSVQNSISSQDTEWLKLLMTRIQELSKKKSFLQELCAKTTVDIIGLVSTDVFIECVYPAVKEIVESGWTLVTPETLLISLAVQRHWGDHIDKTMIENAWKCSLIADKKNYKQMAFVLQDSISAHPRVHCVWDEIFLTLFDNPASDFQLFWKTVVEDGLFESTHERKFLGFQLVKKILSQVSADQVPVVFNSHMMRSFVNSLSSSQTYLHQAAKHLASSLPAAINQNTNPDVPAEVLKHLLGSHGSMHFDQLTSTRTIDSLLGTLKGSGLKKFVSWLLDIFTKGFVEESAEQELSKTAESIRISVLNQLFSLVKNKSIAHEGDWVQEVLFFFLEHAYFQPISTELQVTLTPAVKRVCEQRFVSALKELLSGKEMKQNELYSIVQHAKELLEDKRYKVASDLWTQTVEKGFQKAFKVITKIQKKRKKSEVRQHEDEVFQVLFSLMALHLFTEPDQALDIIKELKVCYERQTKNEDESNDEPHWVEVLTDVLLSLLARPSSLFRHVVDQVFTVLAPHMTLKALNMILESLDPRKGDEGDALEIVDESDEEDDNDMEVDDANGKKKEKASDGGNDEDGGEGGSDGENEDDDDEDNEEGDSSSDDEPDPVGVVDEAFRAEVEAALGPAMVDMENEGSSSSDNELDDEAMMRLDDALAVAFKTHLKAKKDKNKKKDAVKIVLHFKLRVLDIIEIFVKKQASNPLVLELIDPLLDVVWSSLNSKDFHMLGERAQALFKNKLCSSKDLPPASAVNTNDVHQKIEHMIKKAMTAPSVTIVSLVTRGCLYLVRVLRGSQTQESSDAKKRDHTGSVTQQTSKTVCLLDVPRMTTMFKKALKNFMVKRSTHLHPVLFTELIDRFPHLGWHLAADLVQYLETAVNNFRKTQACVMLSQLLSKRTADHQKRIQHISSSLQTTLSSLLTSAAASDTQLKVKNVRDILKLATKFVNETKTTDQTTVLLQTDQLTESLSLVQRSALAERSPDIKRSCNTILSILSRSVVQEPNTKKKKRNPETNGHHFSKGDTDIPERSTQDENKQKKKKKTKKKKKH